MLNLYSNTSLNNMYVNQNFGYGQPVSNPYQQQTSLFSGLQQQPAYNMNSNNLLLSIMSSILPMLLGSYCNQSQPAINNQLPASYAFPGTNINNWGNIGNINVGGTGFTNPWGNLASYSQPQQTNTSNMLQQLLLPLLKSLLSSGTTGKKPVQVDEESIDIATNSGGDPHFYIGGNVGLNNMKGGHKLAYDFQGEHKKIYSVLDNSDISVKARFLDANSPEAVNLGVAYSDVERVMGDMNVEIKDTGINIVGHNNGTFEIFENGKKIADQTNYKDVESKLKAKDITINNKGFAANQVGSLCINYGKRNIELTTSHGGMWMGANRMKNDTGLNEQAYGALDTDRDGNTKGVIDTNKDGKVDDKDNLKYNIQNQVMVDGYGSATALTKEQEEAIKKDIKIGLEKGGITKGFSKDHGYTAMQWNEYVGGKVFSTTDKLLSA